MTKPKLDPIEEIINLLKKQLIVNLYALNVSQEDIAKRLHLGIHTVNEFLKGIKKNTNEKK